MTHAGHKAYKKVDQRNRPCDLDEKDCISLTDMANGKHDESRALTPILKWPNLTTLKCRQVFRVLR